MRNATSLNVVGQRSFLTFEIKVKCICVIVLYVRSCLLVLILQYYPVGSNCFDFLGLFVRQSLSDFLTIAVQKRFTKFCSSRTVVFYSFTGCIEK